MRGLSKNLRTLDAHLAQQNRQRPRGLSPMGPMPVDPMRCRWCHGTLRSLIAGEPPTYCQSGCATNAEAPTKGHCGECGREFYTGLPLMKAVVCHECDRREDATMRASAPTGFEPTRDDNAKWAEKRQEQRKVG